MLRNFFSLDGETRTFTNQKQMRNHFETSNNIKNVLYKPNNWPKDFYKLEGATFDNVSLSWTIFDKVTFNQCNFTNCLFIGSEFRDVAFHRCSFSDCNFYKAEFENCYLDPLTIRFDKSYKDSHPNVNIGLFQKILHNSSSQDQADFYRNSDILFRVWKRAQLKYDLKTGKITKRERFLKYTGNLLSEKLSSYGYSPGKFFLWTIVVFLIISVINHFILSPNLISNNDSHVPVTIWDSIFYTFSILTVLGFSSITPVTPCAKLLSVFEALLAIGWLGVFTSVLVKRFIR